MKARNIEKDADYVLRELKRLVLLGLNLDRGEIIDYFRDTQVSRYEALKNILLRVICSEGNTNGFLTEAHYILYTRAQRNDDPNYQEYYKRFMFFSSLIKVDNLKKTSEAGKLIIVDNACCGNCNDLLNKFIDIDVTYETFPIPIKDCKKGLCSAFCITASLRYIEKNNYQPLSQSN